jgi:hypothetical protein
MGPKIQVVLGALLTLGAIRELQHGSYVWAALGFAVAISCGLRAYKLWNDKPA